MLAIEFFERGVERFPDRVLVRDAATSITYREMSDLALRIASALTLGGVAKGDRVSILSPNHPLVLACQYGIVKSGAVWTPGNYRYLPADTVRQVDALRVGWMFFHSSLDDHVAGIRDAMPTIRGFVCIDGGSSFAPSLDEWLVVAGDSRPEFPACTMEDPMMILTTSGTTGIPKGAQHSNRSLETMIASYYAVCPFDEPPVHLVVAPLTHAAGVYHWTVLALGGTNILTSSADPDEILSAIERHRVSVLFLPPTLIYMLLAHPNIRKYDYSSLRYFIYGAAPMSIEKLREAVDVFGPAMTQNYGQSECLMIAVAMTPREHVEILTDPAKHHRISSAGREAPFNRVEILDEDGNVLPRGEVGEIVFRSDYVMMGYFDNPDGTREVSRFGWHHTGDVGRKDQDGYIYLMDRKSDMIISGGFNVYPAEVEQTALAHPAVQDCAVVGVPHEKWGEAVMAAIELKAGATLDEGEFLAFCKQRLGSVKTPKAIEIWETLPRSTVGKVLRREVRAKHWAGRERAI